MFLGEKCFSLRDIKKNNVFTDRIFKSDEVFQERYFFKR